jgi:hypothetical protein
MTIIECDAPNASLRYTLVTEMDGNSGNLHVRMRWKSLLPAKWRRHIATAEAELSPH